jgi:hypothetical protein
MRSLSVGDGPQRYRPILRYFLFGVVLHVMIMKMGTCARAPLNRTDSLYGKYIPTEKIHA